MGDDEQQSVYQPNLMLPGMNSPIGLYGSAIQEMTNPSNLIEDVENIFRGERYDDKGEVKQVGSRMMNEEGINSVMGKLRSLVNQVTVMSNLSERQIYNHTLHLADVLIQSLMINWKRYGIVDEKGKPDYVTRTAIVTIACNAADICMKRALFETGISDKRFWRGTTQEIAQNFNDRTNKGLIKGLFGGGK
jgi:hypothetical protein